MKMTTGMKPMMRTWSRKPTTRATPRAMTGASGMKKESVRMIKSFEKPMQQAGGRSKSQQRPKRLQRWQVKRKREERWTLYGVPHQGPEEGKVKVRLL